MFLVLSAKTNILSDELTELSKHVWHLKQKKTDFTIKWSMIKKSISYTGGSKRCNLCLEEKISILKEKNNCLLNKRSEIVSACQHKSRFQVNNLNKERNACYSTTHAHTFPPRAIVFCRIYSLITVLLKQ